MPRPRGKPQDGDLSSERLAFCEGILEGKSHREAYEGSGFKARGRDAAANARQLLKEPEVQAYIAARRIELRERKISDAERVVEEISGVAFANYADFGAYDVRGPEDLPNLPYELQMLVKGWKWDQHGNFVLQFEDRAQAREQLMKHFGLYQAERRNEHDGGAMLLATAIWQFVISLHVSKGLSIEAGLRMAEQNPDVVDEWARRNGIVPASEGTA